MRRFVIVSHTGKASGDWPLDDLCGAAGRVDVLCRALNSAFFVSHGIREDVEAVLVFVDPARPTAVRFDGAHLNRLNPDERSLASRVQQALRARGEDPWWERPQDGLHVAPFTLQEVIDDLRGRAPDAVPVLLDPKGEPLEAAVLPAEPVFFLSDHRPFNDAEHRLFEGLGARRVSLGDAWYHGNHVISCVHWCMDRLATPAAR